MLKTHSYQQVQQGFPQTQPGGEYPFLNEYAKEISSFLVLCRQKNLVVLFPIFRQKVDKSDNRALFYPTGRLPVPRKFVKITQSDENARQQLIEGNLRLVLSVIQQFEKRGENPDDLFQVGCIGLIKAISNFDPTKQVRFSTYGVPMIVESRNNQKRSFYYDKKASNQ